MAFIAIANRQPLLLLQNGAEFLQIRTAITNRLCTTRSIKSC